MINKQYKINVTSTGGPCFYIPLHPAINTQLLLYDVFLDSLLTLNVKWMGCLHKEYCVKYM